MKDFHQLMGLVFLLILNISTLYAKQVWQIYPTHLRLQSFHTNSVEAGEACAVFAALHNVPPLGSCNIGTFNDEYNLNLTTNGARLVSDDPLLYHYGDFFYPDYVLVAVDATKSCDTEGNPCDVVTGRKAESITDLTVGDITIKRYYDSQSVDPGTNIGTNW